MAYSDRESLEKGLASSFSNVKYHEIAPFVGLEPTLRLRDAPTLEMHRARISNVLFKDIIGDIEIVMDHRWITRTRKEATSRFLAPVGV